MARNHHVLSRLSTLWIVFVCSLTQAQEEPDSSNDCLSTLSALETALQQQQQQQQQQQEIETITLCPNTELVLDESSLLLPLGRSIVLQCGTDGLLDNNCTLTGGRVQFSTTSTTSSASHLLLNATLRGLTLRQSTVAAVQLEETAGRFSLENCLLTEHEGTQVLSVRSVPLLEPQIRESVTSVQSFVQNLASSFGGWWKQPETTTTRTNQNTNDSTRRRHKNRNLNHILTDDVVPNGCTLDYDHTSTPGVKKDVIACPNWCGPGQDMEFSVTTVCQSDNTCFDYIDCYVEGCSEAPCTNPGDCPQCNNIIFLEEVCLDVCPNTLIPITAAPTRAPRTASPTTIPTSVTTNSPTATPVSAPPTPIPTANPTTSRPTVATATTLSPTKAPTATTLSPTEPPSMLSMENDNDNNTPLPVRRLQVIVQESTFEENTVSDALLAIQEPSSAVDLTFIQNTIQNHVHAEIIPPKATIALASSSSNDSSETTTTTRSKLQIQNNCWINNAFQIAPIVVPNEYSSDSLNTLLQAVFNNAGSDNRNADSASGGGDACPFVATVNGLVCGPDFDTTTCTNN